MAKRIGLRSHCCVESRWVPPKGRFVSLEASDEPWARYFGLGRVETKPMELYDVRDLRGKLIGYSGQDPSSYPHPIMLVHVLDKQVERQCYQAAFESNIAPAVSGVVKSIEVMTRLFSVEHEKFVCWCVRIEDSEALTRAGWLKCLGEDRLQEFIWSLRKRQYEGMY